MKLFSYVFMILFVGSSCMNSQSKEEKLPSRAESGTHPPSFKTHYFVDGKTGLVVYQKDFPSDWEIVTKPSYALDQDFPLFMYRIQNNKGMKGFNMPMKQFIAFQNPYQAETMKSYGMQNIRSLVSPSEIIEQEIKPLMERDGFTLLGQREFPEIIAYANQKKREMNMPNLSFNISATEWVNKNDIKGLVMFNQVILTYDASMGTEPMQIWNYQIAYLFAPNDDYETVLKNAIASDINKIESRNWLQYQAQVNGFRQQQQTAQHEQRMRNQQQQFDQHQQMMQNRYAANDANHAQFMDKLRSTSTNTGFSSDASHQNFIDMIREEQNVGLNGQTFKVEAGAENYWMNSDGKYIMSNTQFYDPNRDPIYDNQRWDLTSKQD